MRRAHAFVSSLAIATATLFAATPAFGQVTGDKDTPAQDATRADPSTAVEEIVVTATRRSENLQDIPLSVATISDETLAAVNSGGADIRALSGRVPSLNIESSFGRTFPRFYIRGLGNTDFDLNASQPVSLVYDDVVLENPILKGFPAFDVDRVEVLRGPQGTLFGRNTPAGIVKFDSVHPFKGGNYARVSLGTFMTVNAEGAVGGKISDTVAVRLSALYQHRNDWIDNVTQPGKNNLDGFDDLAVRGQIEFRPSEATKIRLTGQLRDFKGNARIFRANAFKLGSNDLVGLDGGAFDPRKVATDGLNFQRLRTQNLSANIEHDFGPATFYSVTGYWHGTLRSRGDIDGGYGCSFCGPGFTNNSYPGFIPFAAQSQDDVPGVKQFTQEVRVASNATTGLGYQAGLFYFNEKLNITSYDFATPTDTTPDAIATQHQNSDALGIFGALTYRTEGGLKLQAGARWNHDLRELTAARPVDTRPAFLGFGGPVAPVTAKVKASVLTWDVSAMQDINDNVNVYARIARGYRAPSIQGRLVFGRDLSVANAEKTMSYELGFKSTLVDKLLRLNADIYLYDTRDMQLTAVGGASNFTTLLNARKVVGKGFEAELEAHPAAGLRMTAGVSYNGTTIHDPNLFVAGCGGAAPLCTVLDPERTPGSGIYSIDGNSLPQAPKWNFNWTVGYEVPMGNGALYAFTDWHYRSRIHFFLYDSVEFSSNSMTEGGLRIGYKTNRFDIAAFSRNILNDKTAVSGIDFNNLTAMTNEPRIIGVELGAKF